MALKIWVGEMNKELKVKGFWHWPKHWPSRPLLTFHWNGGGERAGGLSLRLKFWIDFELEVYPLVYFLHKGFEAARPLHCRKSRTDEKASLRQLPHRSNGLFPCEPQPQS